MENLATAMSLSHPLHRESACVHRYQDGQPDDEDEGRVLETGMGSRRKNS